MLKGVVATVPRLRKSLRASAPGLKNEREMWARGEAMVVGIDEVGRGAWAGPITVGAAVAPQDRRVYKIRDSKLLRPVEREALFERIADWCVAWAVGHASAAECDRLGMSDAQRLAARRALAELGVGVDGVLLDGRWDFVGHPNTRRLVGGDRLSLSIAAASILAKVTRDRIMKNESRSFPAYNFDDNKGYPCPVHRAALHACGPSTIHRRSWVFMDGLVWSGVPRFHRPSPQGTLPFDGPGAEGLPSAVPAAARPKSRSEGASHLDCR